MKKTKIFAILTTAWLLTSCGGERHANKGREPAPVSVKTATVQTVEWPAIYEATGTVRARTAATLSAKVMGHVREVTVDAGNHVKKGQLLVRLDSRDLDAAYQRAEAGLQEARSAMAEVENAIRAADAQLKLAQATYRRMKDLYDKKSISDQEFDEVTAKLRMAEANHQMAVSKRAQLRKKIQQAEEAVKAAAVMKGYARITAPFTGTVTARMVEPGNLAAPGVPLLTVERAGAYRLEAQVEESRIAHVHLGEKVEVELEALDRTVSARVSEIVPAVDAASRAFLVKINLPPLPHLRSGLFGRARFTFGARQVVVVPEQAVMSRGQVRSVFVIEKGHARRRLVSLGRHSGGQVEVLSGLTAGDKVVAPVPVTLADGAAVEVRS